MSQTTLKRTTKSSSQTSPTTKAWLDIRKTESRILGDVKHLLIQRLTEGDGRSTDFLHPSDLAKDTWCERGAYFTLIGAPAVASERPPYWRMGSVFNEGHMIHEKYQGYFWDMGSLEGQWHCRSCKARWWGIAPEHCQTCEAPRWCLRYEEVPLFHPYYGIEGHADGVVGTLIEIKSLGKNTLLFEHPQLLADHTYRININGRRREFLDYDELWDSITHPFSSHIRQGDIYGTCWNYDHAEDDQIEEIVFIYECKWNQQAKEFVVKFKPSRIQPILDACRRVLDAVGANEPPPCSRDEKECGECKPFNAVKYKRSVPADLRRNGAAHSGGRFKRSAH